MRSHSAETYKTYAQAFAFLGNSLLKPMTQTSSVGLDARFWREFPDFGLEEVAASVDACILYVEGLESVEPTKAVEEVSVEYTKLFVGPPKPAAPPWETMYRSDDVTVGFGDPTFEMRDLLRKAGLQLSNENRQYEDHMGIELLYLSTLCTSAAGLLESGEKDAAEELASQARDFVQSHPLSWLDSLSARVGRVFPEGYFFCLLTLCGTLLESFIELQGV